MKHRVAVVSHCKCTSERYGVLIKSLFDKYIEVEIYNLEDGSLEEGVNADLILISSFTIFQEVKKYVRNNAEIIILNYTITKKGFNKLKQLPSGTKAMLVNINAKVCMETIALIFQLGCRELNLISVYPGLIDLPDVSIAITPGEIKCVPTYLKKIIDIGDRVPEKSTIIDVATKLNLREALNDFAIKEYFNKIMPISYGLEKMLVENKSLNSQQNILLEVMEQGIIITNSFGLIFAYNDSAEKILGISRDKAIGYNYLKVISEIKFEQVLTNLTPIKNKLVKINNMDIDLSVFPITYSNNVYGAMAIVNRFIETEKKQHKLRVQLLGKGHLAKYTFNDILGESKTIEECKKIAGRIASSDAPVLITSESGTGKELFAQGIHNASKRYNDQFVAINCAALPESLLESELFGYEGGAFTGAKKEGKLGLFELAHNGTLFLDEIGDMPLNLQARLLRVLQEKTVMRVGGDSIMNVNVRIICATNKNLKKLIIQNKFRNDLYYRISVLPLNIPPLREHKDDILVLTEAFKKEFNANFILTDSAKEEMEKYDWQGNVRELRNYIEYLSNLGEKCIDVKDLPFIERKLDLTVNDELNEEKIINQKFLKNTNDRNGYVTILKLLDKSYKEHTHLGRRSLSQIVSDKGVFLSEQEIRSIILKLESYGFVEIKKGRAGTKITETGQRALKQIKENV
ncbi:MAG: transcriptional regulator with PAS, ATPase and Fis domain [Clostridium sp.]|jgi:transcriptional regulator with PAS, ATPase and Fis domain